MQTAPVRSLSLNRHERIAKRTDFLRAYRQGHQIFLPGLTVILVPNSRSYCRLGISAGRKIGGAVQRNKAKRQIRELFRHNKALFPPGHDVIFVANRKILEFTSPDLRKAFILAFRTNRIGK